jgi:T-complex protein 1 subunit theta
LQVLEYLEALVEPGSEKIDVRNKEDVAKRMNAAVASKQYGQEDILCPLIAEVGNNSQSGLQWM